MAEDGGTSKCPLCFLSFPVVELDQHANFCLDSQIGTPIDREKLAGPLGSTSGLFPGVPTPQGNENSVNEPLVKNETKAAEKTRQEQKEDQEDLDTLLTFFEVYTKIKGLIRLQSTSGFPPLKLHCPLANLGSRASKDGQPHATQIPVPKPSSQGDDLLLTKVSYRNTPIPKRTYLVIEDSPSPLPTPKPTPAPTSPASPIPSLAPAPSPAPTPRLTPTATPTWAPRPSLAPSPATSPWLAPSPTPRLSPTSTPMPTPMLTSAPRASRSMPRPTSPSPYSPRTKNMPNIPALSAALVKSFAPVQLPQTPQPAPPLPYPPTSGPSRVPTQVPAHLMHPPVLPIAPQPKKANAAGPLKLPAAPSQQPKAPLLLPVFEITIDKRVYRMQPQQSATVGGLKASIRPKIHLIEPIAIMLRGYVLPDTFRLDQVGPPYCLEVVRTSPYQIARADGSAFDVFMHPSSSVLELKQEIGRLIGVPVRDQTLLYKSAMLMDDTLLTLPGGTRLTLLLPGQRRTSPPRPHWAPPPPLAKANPPKPHVAPSPVKTPSPKQQPVAPPLPTSTNALKQPTSLPVQAKVALLASGFKYPAPPGIERQIPGLPLDGNGLALPGLTAPPAATLLPELLRATPKTPAPVAMALVAGPRPALIAPGSPLSVSESDSGAAQDPDPAPAPSPAPAPAKAKGKAAAKAKGKAAKAKGKASKAAPATEPSTGLPAPLPYPLPALPLRRQADVASNSQASKRQVTGDQDSAPASESDDDEIICDIVAEIVNAECPILQRPITMPRRNTLCGHYYDKLGVDSLFSQRRTRTNRRERNRALKCPVAGCENRKFFKKDIAEAPEYFEKRQRVAGPAAPPADDLVIELE